MTCRGLHLWKRFFTVGGNFLFTETNIIYMETIQLEIPAPLLQQIQQEASANKTLDQVIAEAIQFWLDRKKKRNADLWDWMEENAGTIEAPEDWSLEHDHYLYGTPKTHTKAVS